MALRYVGDHMIEVMSPRQRDDRRYMFARYLEKMGPSYHSISFHIADAAAARARCEERGILLSTTGPGLLFIHPKSSGGIVMELTDHRMPNDPWELPNWRRDWAAGRADRPHALAHIVCAPRDPVAAIAFLTETLGGMARPSFTIDWPQHATATPVDVADGHLLIVEPADRASGPLADFASGPNAGVYALAWRAGDPDATAAGLDQNDIAVTRVAGSQLCAHEALLDGARHWLIAG